MKNKTIIAPAYSHVARDIALKYPGIAHVFGSDLYKVFFF